MVQSGVSCCAMALETIVLMLSRLQAADHGNDDAKKRLEALQLSNPETLNRTDHDANVETKLIRKRTAAKIRSDEQRERLASSKLAASLSGANLGPGPSGHVPPPVNVSLAQAQYQHGMRPPNGQPGASYPSQSLRRNHTMRQVEEAARMGPPPPGTPNPMNPTRPAPGQYPSPSPSPSGRLGYQLSDAPPSQRPPPQQQQPMRPPPQQQPGRPQGIPVQAAPDKHKPATFAEMVCARRKIADPTLADSSSFFTGHRDAEGEEGRLRYRVRGSAERIKRRKIGTRVSRATSSARSDTGSRLRFVVRRPAPTLQSAYCTCDTPYSTRRNIVRRIHVGIASREHSFASPLTPSPSWTLLGILFCSL